MLTITEMLVPISDVLKMNGESYMEKYTRELLRKARDEGFDVPEDIDNTEGMDNYIIPRVSIGVYHDDQTMARMMLYCYMRDGDQYPRIQT